MSETVDLIIPNIAEYNLRHPALRLGPAVEGVFREQGAALADQCFLWSDHTRVLILPAGVDELWFDDVHAALRLDVPPVVCPLMRSGLLLKDLLYDGAALARLRALVRGFHTVRVLTWGATPEVHVLAAVLQSWGTQVELEGTAEKDYWASLYLDSKQSCQDFAGRVSGVRLPETITVNSHEELRGALSLTLEHHGRAIVKSAFGVGGNGSAVVSADRRGLAGFWTTMHREPFFHTFPLMVQEFVTHAAENDCPAVDLFIDDGGIRETVLSSMTVEGQRCRSVDVGARSLPPELGRRILPVARGFGGAAHRLGFRGWFCVDLLVSADGDLYVTEINARRSGATDAICLLKLLSAGDKLVAHSNDTLAVDLPGATSYEDVRAVFRQLWAEGLPAYPTSIRGLARSRPSVSVLTAGSSPEEASELATRIRTMAGRGACIPPRGVSVK